MKLSTSHWLRMADPTTGCAYTPAESLGALKTAGYDSVDINIWALCGPGKPMSGDDWERVTEEFCAASRELELPVWQTHGDTYNGTEWDDPDFPYRELRHETTLRCIEASRRMEADCMVMHPFNLAHTTLYSQKENRDACIAYLAPYIEAAKKAGVRIAVENMIDFGRRHRRYCAGDIYELIDLVDTINDPAVGMCIDTGHANISGMKAGDAIRAAGKRLIAIHVNDNNSKTGLDQHLLPFFGDVDWPDVMRALREIGYAGHFTYEIGPQQVPDAARDQWLRYTVEIGRYLLALK
ncbi:MAG: sugar phosphate isomerase/epimerase [Clostridia bacterium]|nr:sugar phosphate isomerase/epimerase [Clostridia bacterium]